MAASPWEVLSNKLPHVTCWYQNSHVLLLVDFPFLPNLILVVEYRGRTGGGGYTDFFYPCKLVNKARRENNCKDNSAGNLLEYTLSWQVILKLRGEVCREEKI